MSLTQQLRVWFSWNLQEKAFKQTLSISKVESELRMKTPSQFEGSQIFEEATDPNFTSIRNQKSFLNLFLFCRCMSDKILTELKVLVLAAPLGSSWIEPRPTTVRHLKEKHFWKSIYQYTLLSSAKNKKKKKSKGETQNHTARPPIRGRHRCLFDSRLSSFSELRWGALFVFEILKIRLQKPRKCARSEDGHWPPCDPADLWPAGKPSAASATGGCRGCRKGRRLENLLWEPREGVGQLVCSNWQPNHPTLHSCSLSQILV